MDSLTPSQLMEGYLDAATGKAASSPGRLLLLGIMAGAFLALGGVVSNTAVHAIQNPGIVRLVSGLVWPIALAIVLLLGGELFLGNTMMLAAVLAKRVCAARVLSCWIVVYVGNQLGGLLLSLMIVWSGQMELNDGALAVYTVQTAINKVSMSFVQALLMGVLCNLLVCAAVLCSLTARETTGRILGAFLPIVYFITSGFENAVANMYLVPVGLLALVREPYAVLAEQAGLDMCSLTWMSYLVKNLLPVTLGNIIGGGALAAVMWYAHGIRPKVFQRPKEDLAAVGSDATAKR